MWGLPGHIVSNQVMIMDEPFGTDAQTRYQMQEELERIWETGARWYL